MRRPHKLVFWLSLALALGCLTLTARAENPTQIKDKLVSSSGGYARTVLVVSWSDFVTPGGVYVQGGRRTVAADGRGNLSAAFMPCPTGVACYSVVATSDGQTQTLSWNVCPSATPLTVSRVAVVGGSSLCAFEVSWQGLANSAWSALTNAQWTLVLTN